MSKIRLAYYEMLVTSIRLRKSTKLQEIFMVYSQCLVLGLKIKVALSSFLSDLIGKSLLTSRNYSSFLTTIFADLYCIIVGPRVAQSA
jgi:hypothetical protein